MKKQLTHTVPARSREATRWARERFSVKSIALSPYLVSLASATTSSSVSKELTMQTGPKISSLAVRSGVEPEPVDDRRSDHPRAVLGDPPV